MRCSGTRRLLRKEIEKPCKFWQKRHEDGRQAKRSGVNTAWGMWTENCFQGLSMKADKGM